MWTIKSHLDLEAHQLYETREDAEIELHRVTEELAQSMAAHVFHDSIGLSTVWDEEKEHYVCFWLTQTEREDL